MRPPITTEARRPHLMPCPRCGEANGVTAISCWKCDLQLMPNHLLEPRPLPPHAPVPDASPPSVLDAEVPQTMAEQVGGAGTHRRDDPHTLPLFVPPTARFTANESSFAARVGLSRVRQLLMALTLMLAGALLGALFIDFLRRDEPQAPVARAPVAPAGPAAAAPVSTPTPVVPAATVQQASAVPATPPTAQTPAAVSPQPPSAAIATPPALPDTVGSAGTASAQALEAAPVARVTQDPPRARAAGTRTARRSTVRSTASDSAAASTALRHAEAQPPPPVRAPCTEQVAALGLCNQPGR